jgi:hypothetical protein
MSKPIIVYCDDKQKLIDDFKEKHGEEYDIRPAVNEKEFMTVLRGLHKNDSPPSIILIDLYHPNENKTDEELKLLEPSFYEVGEELDVVIKKARDITDKVCSPLGLKLLERVREEMKMFADVPIAIYTKQGVSVIKDECIGEVADYRAEWLLKGRSKDYESGRLDRMLTKATENKECGKIAKERAKITKRALWFLAGFMLIAPIPIFAWLDRMTDYFVSLCASLPTFVMALIMPFLIERYTQKNKRTY